MQSLSRSNVPANGAKTSVFNSHEVEAGRLPANTVFVGPGSQWENPFVIGRDGDRDEVCDRYEYMLACEPMALESIDRLKGMNLLCHDAPYRSHADTLLKLAAINYRARLEWAEDVKAKMADFRPSMAA